MTFSDRSHYALQREARHRSRLIVTLFVLATLVIAVIVGAMAAVLLSPGVDTAFERGEFSRAIALLDPGIFLLATAAVVLVIGGAALYQIVRLGADGATVARALGGTEVTRSHSNFMIRRYVNIVEEMALAANLPVPRIFVLKGEQSINAFAAGRDPSRAAVAVTHGALSSLNRAELSGVVAHEMAHIRAFDTALNVRLMGLIHGLVILFIIGRLALRAGFIGGGRRGRGRGGNGGAAAAILVFGVALLVLGGLGVVFGRLMQAAVSRQREYLADATAVAFTGHPEGLANALKKIGALGSRGALANPRTEEARHMMFSHASAKLGGGGLSTHPPLIERIRRLEPGFEPDTDPNWRRDQKSMIRDARAEALQGADGPWGRRDATTTEAPVRTG